MSKDDFEVDILICMCWEVNYFFIWRVGLFKNEIWEGKRSERKKRNDLLKNKSVKNLVNTFDLKVNKE